MTTRRALATKLGALTALGAGWLAACGVPGRGGATTAPSTAATQPARVAVMTFSNGVEIDQSVTSNLAALWNGTKSPKEVAAAIVAECAPLMNK